MQARKPPADCSSPTVKQKFGSSSTPECRLSTHKTAKTASKVQLRTFRGKWHNHRYIRDDYASAGLGATKTIHLEIRRSGCFQAHYWCRLPSPLRSPGGHQKSPAFGPSHSSHLQVERWSSVTATQSKLSPDHHHTTSSCNGSQK